MLCNLPWEVVGGDALVQCLLRSLKNKVATVGIPRITPTKAMMASADKAMVL